MANSVRFNKHSGLNLTADQSVSAGQHEDSYLYELSAQKTISELRSEIAKLSFENNQHIERGLAH